MAVTWFYLPLTISRVHIKNLGMWACKVHLRYIRFSQKSVRYLAKRRLCLGAAGVINCTPPSALSFWVSLFPRTHGYNFARLKTVSLYFPTASPSLSCLLTLVPLWSIKAHGIQTPIRWLFWGASLSSSWSASSLIKVSSLPQHLVSRIQWPVMWQAERVWTQ